MTHSWNRHGRVMDNGTSARLRLTGLQMIELKHRFFAEEFGQGTFFDLPRPVRSSFKFLVTIMFDLVKGLSFWLGRIFDPSLIFQR